MRHPLVRLAVVAALVAFAPIASRAADRPLVKFVHVTIPAEDAWRAWSTVDGLKKFFAQDAAVELRPGGKFEVYFSGPENAPNRGSEGCTVLSYLPGRMLSFTWNCPPKFAALRAQGPRTFVVVEFFATPDKGCDVRLTHLGWPDGEEWNQVRDYFDNAWSFVLGNLAATFNPPASK